MRKRGRSLLVPIAVSLLCGGLLLAYATIDDLPLTVGLLSTRTPTCTPTWTPAPTPTATVTNTPVPTTASSTATSTPNATLKAGPPPRIEQYAPAIAEKGQALIQAAHDLGQLLQAPQFYDQGWKREVGVHVATIDGIHQELKDMAVPVEMIGLHSALLDASFECGDAVFFLSNADTINTSDVRVASRLMASCSEKFSRHSQQLEVYMKQSEQWPAR